MKCTCGYPARWLIPYCDVIAVGRCEYFLHIFGGIILYDVAQLMFPDN